MVIAIEKLHFQIFSRGSNSSGLNSVFEKLRFPDGIVWTVGLTAKAAFSIFSDVLWTGL